MYYIIKLKAFVSFLQNNFASIYSFCGLFSHSGSFQQIKFVFLSITYYVIGGNNR